MSPLVSMITLPFVVAAINPDIKSSSVDVQPTTEATVTVEPGDWMDSFEEAQRAATDQNIPMVLHFEASWCGPCRRMDSTVLSKPAVKDYLGSRVIGVRVDADRYRSLIDRYRVSTLPTEVIIAPDGKEVARYVGAVSLQSYLSRLDSVARQVDSSAASEKIASKDDQNSEADAESEKTRSCLIVRRDGKMVGLGGFSPVALSENRKWQRGQEEFVVSFQGVDYFLQSEEEVTRFEAKPEEFIPHLHGCDPVELHRSKQARAGAIEFGSFYKGEMFFFASMENRTRFQNNPAWYLASDQQPEGESEAVELLDMIR